MSRPSPGTRIARSEILDPIGDQPSRSRGRSRPAEPDRNAQILRSVRGLSSADAPATADNVTALAHELANLLDGSMRWVSLAATSLRRSRPAGDEAGQDPTATALRQIEAASAGLERMAALVDAALRSKHAAIGSPDLQPAGAARPTVTLAEAVDHAADVITPAARMTAVDLRVRIERSAGQAPAGTLYSVILNALRNAVEACAEGGSVRPGGAVEIAVFAEAKTGRLVLEVLDDGVGPPITGDPNSPFRHGFTTKRGTVTPASPLRGLGLAIADGLVRQAGGEIALLPRGLPEPGRPGAVLRVTVPPPQPDPRLFGGNGPESGGA